MKVKITGDFVIGFLAGTATVLYLTTKKFADIIRSDKYDTPEEDESAYDLNKFIFHPDEDGDNDSFLQ